jgi:hypothetical protein
MKRSEINKTIKDAIKFFMEMNFPLPLFAYFTPRMWRINASDYKEVVECRLGWDVTDAGLGDFKNIGRTIFTLRNGNTNNLKIYQKSYAQKIMYLQENQRLPVHYHQIKMEDIINQHGGILQVRVWPKNNNKELKKEKFPLSIDGHRITVFGGTVVSLKPGQSICIMPGICHQFWAKRGCGPVLSMEISSVNDDLSDNIWLEHAVRFPKIIEDVEKEFLLCSEYTELV